MEPVEAFAVVLRELRRKRGLSQQALALEADVDRTFVSLLERGKRQPSLDTLFRLAAALSISPTKLIARVEEVAGADRSN